jgi:hypothetical protein
VGFVGCQDEGLKNGVNRRVSAGMEMNTHIAVIVRVRNKHERLSSEGVDVLPSFAFVV